MVVDIRHAATLRFGGDDLTRLALGADHQDGAAVGRQLTNVLHRLLVHTQGFFQVDDMNLVAVTEDERRHLGIPETGLMSKMDARFQHLSHRHAGHKTLLVGLSLRVSQSATRRSLEIRSPSLQFSMFRRAPGRL